MLSGFSVYLLIELLDLPNVMILACLIMVFGAGVLFYIAQQYDHAFPDAVKRSEEIVSQHSTQRLRGPMRQYVVLLFSFFVLSQIVMYLVEFQYLAQLHFTLDAAAIAGFLGIFSGILGLVELLTQWFFSSRLIERDGVFAVTMALPIVIVTLSAAALSLLWSLPGPLIAVVLFWGLVALKFMDEWLRYTLVASTRPVLFQPIPDLSRGRIQSLIGGIAEPLSMGFTGVGILATIWICQVLGLTALQQSQLFLSGILVASGIWLLNIYWLRSRYLDLLVASAERGLLSFSDASLRALKKAFIEQLQTGREEDKRSCIELLSHLDPKGLGEALSPMLPQLSSALQRQGLDAMLEHPSPAHVGAVRSLTQQPQVARQPEVLARALRYIWIAEENPDIQALRSYLKQEIDPVVRATAASLMLKYGNSQQRAEATNTLRQMLTHPQERERVMGCRALGEARYMQALRLYIPDLLRDDSLRVRRALLEAIAATHLEEYYPSLLRALQYKSTRSAAVQALTRLGNEVLPLLIRLAEDAYQPDLIRNQAWTVIGQIGTPEALSLLVSNLLTSWGQTRHNILRILTRLSQETGLKRTAGIDAALDQLGRPGIERLIDQELTFTGQVYAGLQDLDESAVSGRSAKLLRNALHDMITDAVSRLFSLMRFLYPVSAVQAAQVSLQGSSATRARGIEILDNTVDIPNKRALLSILDGRSTAEIIQSLSLLIRYQPMTPLQRLHYLLDLRYFLSDWSFACCVHLARQQRWQLQTAHVLAGLNHPSSFIREAVLSYLKMASPRTLKTLLPQMKQDPDPLVAAQVAQLMATLEPSP